MPGERPRATLSDKQSRGGVIGGKGYGFQAAYIVSRIPLWLADPDFTQFLQEGAGDVDVRFDRVEGKECRYVQVKNYLVKPAAAREVFAQFRETDAGSPGTYTHFTLACPGLDARLKQLRAAVEELRGADPFFRSGEDPILDNTWADLERLVEKLDLPVDAGFLVSKVHFDTDLAGLGDDDSLRRLFVGGLVELEDWAGVPPEAAVRAYEKLALKCHQALRETYARERVEAIIQEAVEEVAPPRVVSDVCPYQGLAAFTEAEAEFFFGRQTVVDRLVERLKREPRFLAVLGPSGSGKSSLVQAGLIPRLRAGAVPGSDCWGVIVARPADQPFHELQTQGLPGAREGLIEAVQTWLDDHPGQTRLMLVMDQFEELLVTSPDDLRGAFVDQLAGLLDTGLPVTVVLTMRDDFFSRLGKEASRLLPWLERGLVYAPSTLSQDELEAIVEEPARAVGLAFEAGLVEVILDDAMEPTRGPQGREGKSTMLPLLEFALTQLWERQREGNLTHEAYEAIGGVTGGLTQWADRTFHGLEREQRQLARRVLTDLVHLGDEGQGLPDSRRRRPLADICRSEGETEAIHQVVRRLADARLLATGRDLESGWETVELIHDALLQEWGLLQEWLEEDRRFLAWRQTLEGRVQTWMESAPDTPSQRDEGRLLWSRDLDEAERWLAKREGDLGAKERAYIRESVALRKRRRRRVILGLAGGLPATLMLGLLIIFAAVKLSQPVRAKSMLLPPDVVVGVTIVAADLHDADNVYVAGSEGGGVWAYGQTDDGFGWTELDDSLRRDLPINGIAAVDKVVYAITPEGLFINRNDGTGWVVRQSLPVISPDRSPQAIAVNPRASEQLYVGIQDAGIFFSTDSGLNWERMETPPEMRAESVRALATNGALILAATGSGIWIGEDWKSISLEECRPPTGCAVSALSIPNLQSDPPDFLAALDGADVRMANVSGGKWVEPPNPLPIEIRAYSLASVGENLYAGSDLGVWCHRTWSWTQPEWWRGQLSLPLPCEEGR